MTVPSSKSSYIGEWEGDTRYLQVTPGGFVYYERLKGRYGSTSLQGNLAGFKGDSIRVGVRPLTSTIHVNQPPYEDGDEWKMVIDGEELVRVRHY
jgi:hypothetical protein